MVGFVLNTVLVPCTRRFAEQEVHKEYNKLRTSHNIDTQSTSGRLKRWSSKSVNLKYENINGNSAYKRPGGKYDRARFDCRVTSHVDFAKLYIQPYMAKFNAFDEHCDGSAVLSLLCEVPVFSVDVQKVAGDVRETVRNAWAHCNFTEWDVLKFKNCFQEMEKLVKVLGLPAADELKVVENLNDWESKGTKI